VPNARRALFRPTRTKDYPARLATAAREKLASV
jgi:hypothetical protein